MTDPARCVHLVDDDPAVLDAMTLLLRTKGYAVAAYASAEAFLDACGQGAEGCVVADLRMPGMDGIELQAELARRGLALSVLFLTGHGDIPTTVKAIKSGAADFLTKPVSGATLMRSIDAALEQARARHDSAPSADAAPPLGNLTPREADVMKLIVAGRSNKEIGKHLGISHRTVEIHKAHLMQKTRANSLMDLARLALKSGLDT